MRKLVVTFIDNDFSFSELTKLCKQRLIEAHGLKKVPGEAKKHVYRVLQCHEVSTLTLGHSTDYMPTFSHQG